ncbi:MAG: hypothetical protein AAFR61_05530 [Bacteroidota bacterium]
MFAKWIKYLYPISIVMVVLAVAIAVASELSWIAFKPEQAMGLVYSCAVLWFLVWQVKDRSTSEP